MLLTSPQFKHWFIYFLLGFVVVTLREYFRLIPGQTNLFGVVTEVYYLNVALALFNTGL